MKLFLLFSHTLTPVQESEARALGVGEFVALPSDLQRLWSHIPPELERLDGSLRPIAAWLEAEAVAGDFVLLAGDFGAVYQMARAAQALGLVPIYATSQRVAIETRQPDGSVLKQSRFEHVRFRAFEPFSVER